MTPIFLSIILTLMQYNWSLHGDGRLLPLENREVLVVSGDGKGRSYWESKPILKPGKIYKISFKYYIEPESKGGAITSPTSNVNIDIPLHFSEKGKWIKKSIVVKINELHLERLKLGIWHVEGTVYFDSINVEEVKALNFSNNYLDLGAGEWIEENQYVATFPFQWTESNYLKFIENCTAFFNTNRYLFSGRKEIVLLHRVKDNKFLKGKVKIQIAYFKNGKLTVEYSRNGTTWQEIGVLTGKATKIFALPDTMFPADSIFIRMSSSPLSFFQVDFYKFTGEINKKYGKIRGRTVFYKERGNLPGILIQHIDPGFLVPSYKNNLQLYLENKRSNRTELFIQLESETVISRHTLSILPHNKSVVNLHYNLKTWGKKNLNLLITDKKDTLIYNFFFFVPPSFSSDFGYLLSENGDKKIWWAESGYTVSRYRPWPVKRKEIILTSAKNEYEAFQLVIFCQRVCKLKNIVISSLEDGPNTLSRNNIKLFREHYIPVSIPSYYNELPAMYPDPILPLKLPLLLKEGNNPLYVRIFIPPDTPEGNYSGFIRFEFEDTIVQVPIKIKVFNFTLPEESHLRSAFGFQPDEVKRYHHLNDRKSLRVVLEKYYNSFKKHRISPYFPMEPTKVRLDCEKGKIIFDFKAFDSTASLYLDKYKFNSYILRLNYFPKGSFYSRTLPEICGARFGTPTYKKLFSTYLKGIVNHLKSKGWLDKALPYWFDEPAEKDYPFVKKGMKLLKEIAPELRTFLTEEPVHELYGYVDIWCPAMGNLNLKIAKERMKKGEQIWWYIAGGPPPSYPTQYIERPSFELRMWPVISFRFGIKGILIWNTNYWTSNLAYPDTFQNPYLDPMSYQRGYGKWKGFIHYWNNGNGRLIYPPYEAFLEDTPVLSAPVSSLRWEALRDGMEDYEYLWMLRSLEVNEDLPCYVKEEIKKLLQKINALVQSPTTFPRNPREWENIRCEMGYFLEKANKYIH